LLADVTRNVNRLLTTLNIFVPIFVVAFVLLLLFLIIVVIITLVLHCKRYRQLKEMELPSRTPLTLSPTTLRTDKDYVKVDTSSPSF
jgi:hypothetical protein